MTYAATEDVQVRLGRALSAEEAALVSVRLADAERKILRRIPDLADKVAESDDYVADVVQVEADAVLRLVRNPEGYRSESDGTYSYEFNSELASGKLEITHDDWTTLGVADNRVFTIAPSFGSR